MRLPNLTMRSIYMDYYNELHRIVDDARRYAPAYQRFTQDHRFEPLVENYFKAKDTAIVESLETPVQEDIEQVNGYAQDILAQFPKYRTKTYVVYIAAGKACKVWETTNIL